MILPIKFCSSSDLHRGRYSDNIWHIFCIILTLFLTYVLTYSWSHIVAFDLTFDVWHSCWHLVWHNIRHLIWHSIWYFIQHSISHIIWHFIRHILTFYLIFCLAFYLTFYLIVLSIRVQRGPELVSWQTLRLVDGLSKTGTGNWLFFFPKAYGLSMIFWSIPSNQLWGIRI